MNRTPHPKFTAGLLVALWHTMSAKNENGRLESARGWGWRWAAGARNLTCLSKKPIPLADPIGDPDGVSRPREPLRELPGRTWNPW
jgi:hypothetical protein